MRIYFSRGLMAGACFRGYGIGDTLRPLLDWDDLAAYG